MRNDIGDNIDELVKYLAPIALWIALILFGLLIGLIIGEIRYQEYDNEVFQFINKYCDCDMKRE